ncbi:MAG TPA: hypothetical protein VHJ17_24430, partial [Thermomonospora sp.]|nr:hypothetical protein [Thermomonospora sp.]
MDPLAASALAATLLKILDGASGEAGRQLWVKLTEALRRSGRRRPALDRAVAEAEEGDGPETAGALAA